MRWESGARENRRQHLGLSDQRNEFARDRDRILYSSAFRRLAGITQIVRANESDVFHNRMVHTLKVAQIGRRLAENLLETNSEACSELGLHPECVEAACLAHDLGHPPFGHLGEKTLDDLVTKAGDSDGYEGNAQSFRIVTKLSVRFEEDSGLDLTRATLSAIIKYPWFRDPENEDKKSKWGAYKAEIVDFQFAREKCAFEGKTTEAALMDWADDIAYSIHDMEDLHRCKLIPWDFITTKAGKEFLVKQAKDTWHSAPTDALGRLRNAYDRVITDFIAPSVPMIIAFDYDGSREHRRQIRFLTSSLISRYIRATKLDLSKSDGLSISPDLVDEVRLLKQLTRSYLIGSPALAAQQYGQKKVITEVFDALLADEHNRIVPNKFQHYFQDPSARTRAVADVVSGLTEHEIISFHRRLNGSAAGSVLDPIIR